MIRHYVGIAAVNPNTKEIVKTTCHCDLDDTATKTLFINKDRVDVSFYLNEPNESILERATQYGDQT